MVAGVFKAKIDPRVEFESQDQLFIFATTAGGGHREEIPLVRGRTPNGRPWIPPASLCTQKAWGSSRRHWSTRSVPAAQATSAAVSVPK